MSHPQDGESCRKTIELNLKKFQRRKIGMRSSRHGPYRLGHSCVTMTMANRDKLVRGSGSEKRCLSVDWRLQLALHEIGIVINRRSARYGEWFGALYTPPVKFLKEFRLHRLSLFFILKLYILSFYRRLLVL